MTQEKKIEYMKLAAGMNGFTIQTDHMDLLITTYEAVIKKEGEFNVKDSVKIKFEVEARAKARRISELLDKASEQPDPDAPSVTVKKKKGEK